MVRARGRFTLKAAVLHGANDIRIQDYRQPELAPGMVLIRNRNVGICGSDLHYYQEGFCGAFVPDRPFVLGHELSGEVAAAGDGVHSVRPGQRVTVNPARNCGFCAYCKSGRINLCRKTIMLGSASTTPPTDGAFAEFVAVRADQCHLLPDGIDDALGALMEPFAVALHAVKRAGPVSGKRVLVAGGGAIGLLVAIAARAFGATPVAVSDPVAARRAKATALAADAALDPSDKDFEQQVRALAGDGFDLVFEASGAPPALRAAFDVVRPGGAIVQIGTLGAADIPLPANLLMIREIAYIGSMRYGDVFGEAIRLVASGRVHLQPLLTTVFPIGECAQALRFAADKSQALKVQIQL